MRRILGYRDRRDRRKRRIERNPVHRPVALADLFQLGYLHERDNGKLARGEELGYFRVTVVQNQPLLGERAHIGERFILALKLSHADQRIIGTEDRKSTR